MDKILYDDTEHLALFSHSSLISLEIVDFTETHSRGGVFGYSFAHWLQIVAGCECWNLASLRENSMVGRQRFELTDQRIKSSI